MVRSCSVLGCPSMANSPSHKFPKNPDQFKIWKEVIWSPKISDLSDSALHKSAVCYRHFKDSDYLVGYSSRKLKKNVVPSLNLPDVYLVYEEGDKFVKKKVMSLNSVDAIETVCNMQDNVVSVNSVDPNETDCNTQMSVNESNANEELLKPTMPKQQQLESLEKNSKKADLKPKAKSSMAKSLRRRQISTMKYSK
ncbi:uncharacterized protein LOC107269755 [Cephus cinctus]|uniref:Uncharacterized protein LOC107269755 n=1 Tax=Cephus cinctus TaxID=211228 RepID=A0AAJ7C167_CEPCN|nr:uncharacterized protein LOC107269755 [Cephus cinctus]